MTPWCCKHSGVMTPMVLATMGRFCHFLIASFWAHVSNLNIFQKKAPLRLFWNITHMYAPCSMECNIVQGTVSWGSWKQLTVVCNTVTMFSNCFYMKNVKLIFGQIDWNQEKLFDDAKNRVGKSRDTFPKRMVLNPCQNTNSLHPILIQAKVLRSRILYTVHPTVKTFWPDRYDLPGKTKVFLLLPHNKWRLCKLSP